MLKQIFANIILALFYPESSWLKELTSMDHMVSANKINLAEVGADPEVVKNNSVWPLTPTQRTDTGIEIVLATFDTKPTHVTNVEEMETNYDKCESVVRQHASALSTMAALSAAHNIAPASHTAATPVLETTGQDRGDGNKALTYEDILRLRTAFNKQNYPMEGRILLLCPEHEEDLLAEDVDRYNRIMTTGQVAGFKVYSFNGNPNYSTAGVKSEYGTTNAQPSSVAFCKSEVMRAKGTIGKDFINATKGEVKILTIVRKASESYEPTIVDGLDSDVLAAAAKAQALAEWACENKYAPFFTILPGLSYSGTASELADLSEYGYNRVGILLGDTVSGSGDACVGLLLGRIASIPVQRSIARVKTGAISETELYIGSVVAENGNPDVIHDAGYICPRTFVGKAGYFWSDDKLATSASDDYALIPRRRTIDKAFRIAYKTLIEELSDEIALTNEGKIPAALCKSLEKAVESDIIASMGENLGTDPDDATDKGVQCYIDSNQVVVSTQKVNVKLRVKPFGYLKYIDVYLGFLVE